MNTKVIDLKQDRKHIGFLFQIIVTLIMLAVGGLALFIKDFKPYFFLALSVNMIVLTINNILFIKKKNMIILYIIFAIYTFILFLIELL